MRNTVVILMSGIVMILILTSSIYKSKYQTQHDIIVQDTLIKFHDGIYEGQSRDIYTGEPFWGKIRITIENGSFTKINFMIRDSSLHEIIKKKYKKHYKGNPEYIQQVKNDSKGIKTYPKILLKTQDINKTDALSGATWSYNIFKASTEVALKKALKH